MASYTAPTLHATGDDLAVTDYNAVANNTTFLYQRPYISAYNSVVDAPPNAATTQVTLGGLTASGYGFSVSSNNIVVPLTGVYSVGATVTFGFAAGSGAAWMQTVIFHNGSAALQGSSVPTTTSFPASSVAGLVSCSANDTLALYVINASGFIANTYPGGGITFIHVSFVGSQ